MSEQIAPPHAPQIPTRSEVHGIERIDNYHWLRERESQEVLDYLTRENEYTELVMKHTEGLQEQLFEEMKGRIRETDMEVPVKNGEYFYYSRTEEGKQFPILCRRPGSMEGEEQVLIDMNAKAEESESGYVAVGIYRASHDHRYLAYSLDLNGSELYTIRILDMTTGEHLPEQIPGTDYSAAWALDNRTLFYTLQDNAHRPHKVLRHQLGDDVINDVEIYHEPDELFRVYVSLSSDDAYVTLNAVSSETSEIQIVDAAEPEKEPRLVERRRQGMRYSIDHRNDLFYILTNDDAPNFRLMVTSDQQIGREHWQEFVPQRSGYTIEGIDLFRRFLVLSVRHQGLQALELYDFESEEWKEINFDESTYSVYTHSNVEFDTPLLRFGYTSLTTPDSTYDYNMETGERELLKRREVRGDFDPSRYHAERIMVRAEDGAEIPVSIVYRSDMFRNDGTNPGMLYAYGSYGATMDPWFDSKRLSLLDRGFVFAIGHIRGGQEMGREWYDAGKLLNKKNTFSDFIACGHALVEQGYTSHDRLVIKGGSAGGLLMGAVINMAPELAAVAVAQVPFVDVVNTMLDATLPLTVGEYEEWGNPNEKEYFDYILSYSPYDNVKEQNYPNILITGGLNDPRVQYWEPAKWTARLREVWKGDRRLLLKTNMGAGHGGASGRYDYLKEVAFEFAFILDTLGIVA